MPSPGRTRSLRKPGYSGSHLVEDAEPKTTTVRQGVHRGKGEEGLNGNEHRASDEACSQPTDAQKGEHYVRDSFPRKHSTAAASNQVPSFLGHHLGLKAGEKGNYEAASQLEGASRSSGLPLPSQLSRVSSLRQPKAPLSQGGGVKRSHARSKSIALSATQSSKLQPTPTVSQCHIQKPCAATRTKSPPLHLPTTVLNLTPAREPSQSSHLMLEQGSGKMLPEMRNRSSMVARPQFSTFQQRFTPKKQSPPSRPTRVASVIAHSSVDLSHLTALQDELLQLQWMYASADVTRQAWIETGIRSLRNQHKRQSREASEIVKAEKGQQNRINAATLLAWLETGRGKLSIEKVERLAQCVGALTGISQRHQRLYQVIEIFEAWNEDSSIFLRDRTSLGPSKPPRSIKTLGQGWEDEVTLLIGFLESCLRDLERLICRDASSGLGLVLGRHTRFAKFAVDELKTMEAVHLMVLTNEDDWLRDETSAILDARAGSQLPAWDRKS